MLQTNACQAFIPDLCQSWQCWLTPTPLQCTQTPAPGTQVGLGNHPISITFVDPVNSQTQTCQVTFSVMMPPGGCPTNCVPAPANMVGWWPLDELTGAATFADLSGNGNAAIVEPGSVGSAGSPSAASGKVAGAMYFNNVTARGRALNSASLNFGQGSFSVDAWVNPVPVGNLDWQPIVDKLNQSSANTGTGYALGILGGKVVLRVGDGTLYTYSSVNTVGYSSWNFVAAAVDRAQNKVTFSVNGVNETAQTLSLSGSINNSLDLLVGGTYGVNGAYGEIYVDELELFNRALATNEVDLLWLADSAGKCKPHSPCSNSVVSIFCPPDTNVETCFNSAIVAYGPASASTSCGVITNLVCTPPSGSSFSLGTTTVICTATDSNGISASCTFKVTVTPDATPPGCPPSSMTITGCPPLVPNFATNGLITDNCTPSGQISVTQSPAAGTPLSAGMTFVTVTACDAAGNCAMCMVSLTAVLDGPPPGILCPSNIVMKGYYYCDSNGVRVIYPPAQVTNGVFVSCIPPSGSMFPMGQSTVTCFATNACGSNQCSFTVNVVFSGLEPPCAPAPSNMVLWLTFDETSGPTAINSCAGNSGTLFNGPTRIPNAYVQRSLCFNGLNQYVQVKPYPAIQFGTGDFSVDAWVKPAGSPNTVRIIVDHREENGSIVRGYALFLGANNTLSFQIADGTFINYPSSLTVPADGQWHFVAVTVKRNNAQGIRFYVDGVQDSVPRDPTGHPGSITAGPCYPFRVGSRSSSVSGVFDGCIDEVELFRRALTAGELQSIYDARCKGKCRVSCQQMILDLPCGAAMQTTGVIYNQTPNPITFNYSWQGLPVGPGCNVPGPTSFTPQSGTITVGTGTSATALIPVQIVPPQGLSYPNCACFQLELTSTDGSVHLICPGRMCPLSHQSFCAEVSPPVAFMTNLEPANVTFTLSGTSPASTVLTNPFIALVSPENDVVSVIPLSNITIPSSGEGSVVVPGSIAFPEYDPGRKYNLVLEADMDGDGQYETLASSKALNIIPSTEGTGPLSIARNPDGEIIIVWPNPCAILEVNPNLTDVTGWTPAPVQTSPYRVHPTSNGIKFFRLRE